MAVSLHSLRPVFIKADIDGNGQLDKAELAKASLHHLGQKDGQQIGSLFATLLQGGKDQKGLFPDFNKDGAIDFNEMKQLSQDKKTIKGNDFKAAFGKRYQKGGQGVDLAKLKTLAQQNKSKFEQCAPGFQHAVGDSLLNGKTNTDALNPFSGNSCGRGFGPHGQGNGPASNFGQIPNKPGCSGFRQGGFDPFSGALVGNGAENGLNGSGNNMRNPGMALALGMMRLVMTMLTAVINNQGGNGSVGQGNNARLS